MSQSEYHSDASEPIAHEDQTEDDATATESPDEETDGIPLSKDDLFHLLQNERRRAVLRYMEGRDEAVRMRDVAEQVAAWEHDTTLEDLTSDQRQRVYIALYQTHLSTLDEAGIINYNKPRGIVEPTPLVDHVVKYVDVTTSPAGDGGDETEWERRYFGVSIASSILLIGMAFDVTVLQFMSSFAASVLILAMFSLLTFAKMNAGVKTEA